jgi:cytochrome P450
MSEETKCRHQAGWKPEEAWAPIEAGAPIPMSSVYQEQRGRCPVAWRQQSDDQGFWTAFDYDTVGEILNDPTRFSSAVPKYGDPLIPIELDPPLHGQYRRLLTQFISPKRMQRLAESIRSNIRAQVAALVKDNGGSVIALTENIPLHAFCTLVGEPSEDEWHAISQKREQQNESRLSLLDAETIARRKAAAQPIMDYCRHQIARHREHPREDLVSDILSGLVDGRPISDEEALRMLGLVYIAGHRTTTAALRGTVLRLGSHPEVQQQLRLDPTLIGPAIEEILRLESPVHALPRYCTQDTTLAGQPIRKGEQVFPVYGAANVDPAVFDRPEEFRLDRRPNHHVAFGRGIHNCAGAPLARLVMRIFIETMLEATERFEVVGTVTRMTWPHISPTRLDIRLTPAAGADVTHAMHTGSAE